VIFFRIAPFRGAVVDLQLAVFQKTRQRFPLIQRIAHCRAGRTLGQNLFGEPTDMAWMENTNTNPNPMQKPSAFSASSSRCRAASRARLGIDDLTI
jgi:hypothetical protein